MFQYAFDAIKVNLPFNKKSNVAKDSSSDEDEEDGQDGAPTAYPKYKSKVMSPGSSNLISKTFDPTADLGDGTKDPAGDQEDNDEGRESVQSTGFITRLDESMPKGVIDRTYCFDIKTFCSKNHNFQLHSKVDFEAFRSNASPAWAVTSMKIHVSKKEIQAKETCRHKIQIMKVVSVGYDWIDAEWGDNKVQRLPKLKDLLPKYQIKSGDWLKVHFEQLYEAAEAQGLSGDETLGKIISIQPSQQKTIVGKITKRGNEFCVEDYIYVTLEAIKGGRQIPLNTLVRCVAVESTQKLKHGEFQWRAVEVSLSNFMQHLTDNHNRDDEEHFCHENVDIRYRDLYDNRGGIKIKPEAYVKFQPAIIGTCVQKSVSVQNMSNRSITLQSIEFPHDNAICKFELELPQRDRDVIRVLAPEDMYTFKVNCTPLQMGRTKEMGLFDFGEFKIARDFIITGLTADEELLNKVKKPEHGHRAQRFSRIRGVEQISALMNDNHRTRIRGTAPIRAPFFVPSRIPSYSVPTEIWDAYREQSEEIIKQHYAGVLMALDINNYQTKFQVSLWFEEVDNDIRRRQYDLGGVRFKRASDYYTFIAPHIQDIQPSVLIGDPIDAFDPEDPKAVKYQGFIKKIHGTEVSVGFSDAFNETYGGGLLSVRFCQGRMTYKRQHYAVELALQNLGEMFLFPFGFSQTEVKNPRIPFFEDEDSSNETVTDEVTEPVVSTTQHQEDSVAPAFGLFAKRQEPNEIKKAPNAVDKTNRRVQSLRTRFVSDVPTTNFLNDVKLNWFNKNLNEEQKNAVRRVLRGQARPLPYIIFGPPGTGKTVTVVEAIMQVNKLDPNSRILVTAPTNHAADVIAECLVKSGQYHPGEFIRFNGFLRQEQGILDSIKEYCTDGELLDHVAISRLIVSTCATAGQFFSLKLTPGHFTHVFIDEAGYCTEPETMISAVNLAIDREGQLIIAGDPKQLGPVLMSDIAQNLDLNLSFLERLMNGKKGMQNIYGRNPEKFGQENCGYNTLVLTKLVKNYRAHESLLKLPSHLFYDDDLVACASQEEAYMLTQNHTISQKILLSQGVPIVFHGVQGTSVRERDSPSWYNAAEVMQVVNYVRTLKSCGVENDDIGIITPYRKQAEKLRLAMKMGLLEDEIPKVGSVEEFQGGERQVVIISTVRSLYEDKINSCVQQLGFIYNEKRFNVAITRAKSLMIVVGNPHVLCKDKHWKNLLRYCIELQAYKGCNLPIELDEVTNKLYYDFKNQEGSRDVPTLPPDMATLTYNPDGLDEDDFKDALQLN
ncbi:RNA helicase Mov10l1 [Folsomia candida]|uniref:RNA helicase n=1 Tax=Folsomia candida TaxID=158441 RepID=A0A226EKS1_FOLCA|nr:RNA helicase Mov10l1 [Folsomia candida]XP_021948805.1 RNA helicase Mov10l1 [Folsomia candida]OXA58303.1 putative RNA helicase armi [Folsomia candida]